MPELMLRYRAAAWFVRAHAPEIAMGLQTVEEVRDAVINVEPEGPGDTLTLDALQPAMQEGVEEAEQRKPPSARMKRIPPHSRRPRRPTARRSPPRNPTRPQRNP